MCMEALQEGKDPITQRKSELRTGEGDTEGEGNSGVVSEW
jgi:hypothetical protein